MTNQYELVFIMTPVLTSEMVTETVDKYKDMVSAAEGKVLHEEHWGMRKLAYPIQKKGSGFYYLMEFNAPGTLIREMETEFKRDERVMRFLTIRMDKYHAEYAERRKAKRGAKSETKVEAND